MIKKTWAFQKPVLVQFIFLFISVFKNAHFILAALYKPAYIFLMGQNNK